MTINNSTTRDRLILLQRRKFNTFGPIVDVDMLSYRMFIINDDDNSRETLYQPSDFYYSDGNRSPNEK